MSSKYNLKSRIRKFEPESFGICLQSVLVLFFMFHILVLTWYFGEEYGPRISWIANDGPITLEHSFGIHNFGDHLQIWKLARESNWDSNNIYPPFAVFIIKLLTWTPYKPTVIALLFSLAATSVLPIILGSKSRELGSRCTYILLLGVFSAPFISILDRGNLIGLLPAIFYMVFVSANHRGVVKGLLLGLASAIKVYPLIILLFLPNSIRRKTALIAFITFVTLNFLTALFWGNPIEIANQIITAQMNFSKLNIYGDKMNFSASSICLNISNYFFGTESNLSQLIQSRPLVVSLLVLLVLSFSAHFGIRARNPITRVFLGLYALQLVPITSYSYTRWWGIVVISLLINGNFMEGHRDRKYETFIWLTILLNIALLSLNEFFPIAIFPSISFILVFGFCIYDLYKSVKIKIYI